MKAIRVHAFGGPEALKFEDVPDPLPKAGEAAVKIDAAGVNFIDTYQRTGAYKIPLPSGLGQEGAGTVTAVGPGVTAVKAGDKVAWTGILGSYAEAIAVPVDRLVALPAGVTTKQGAAIMLQGMTAHYLATSTYPLKAGDTCLVHAGAGGAGLLLTQIAKMRGARVITTVSTDEKATLSREAGADHVVHVHPARTSRKRSRRSRAAKGCRSSTIRSARRRSPRASTAWCRAACWCSSGNRAATSNRSIPTCSVRRARSISRDPRWRRTSRRARSSSSARAISSAGSPPASCGCGRNSSSR